MAPFKTQLGLLLSSLSLLGAAPALANPIVPDTGAQGTGTVVTPNGPRFDITGGTKAGRNLFHSFQKFGLNEGQIANFLANPSLRNIISRVTGGDPSVIRGLIQVTGGSPNLFLLNPAGVIFGPTASLNVPAAFTATTANGIGFANGWFGGSGPADVANLVGDPNRLAFSSANPGSIVNAGNLAVNPGQSLNLVGGQVVNTGTLTAAGGGVTLAAVPGQNLVRLSQPGFVMSLELQPLPGGFTEDGITAATLPQLLTGGSIQGATGLTVNPDGTVLLTATGTRIAEQPGTVVAAGRIDTRSEQTGGTIQVLGETVGIVSATLDASGKQGGGTILVGGDFRGQGTTPTAQTTLISTDSQLRADALERGNGGKVIAWADGTTAFSGAISARGGAQGGDGGFVEVSGKETLIFRGQVDTRAPQGQTGTLLLDPTDITIVAGSGDGDGNGSSSSFRGLPSNTIGQVTASDTSPVTIFQSELQGLPGSTNVILEATNNITVEPMTGNTLAFQPGTGSVEFRADADSNGIGNFTMNASDSIFAPGRDITISGANLNLGVINTTSFSGDGGDITLTASADITAAALFSGALSGSGGGITVSAGQAVVITGAPDNVFVSSAINTAGGNKGGAVSVDANSIDLQDAVVTGSFQQGQGGNVTLEAEGDILTGGILTAGRSTEPSTPGQGGKIEIRSQSGSVNTTAGQPINPRGVGPLPFNLITASNGIAGDVTIDAAGPVTTGAILTGRFVTPPIPPDFPDGITLDPTTAGDVTLKGSSVTAGTIAASGTTSKGDLTLTGDEINLTGGSNSVAGGTLKLQALSNTQPIVVAGASDSGAGALDLTTTDLAALSDGFSQITIGGDSSQGGVTINTVSFSDPILIQSPNGGTLNVLGQITGTDNASIELKGSGSTTVLNAGITTSGTDITIDDSVILGVSSVALSTGGSAGRIEITGAVNGAADFSLNAETVELQGDVGSSIRLASVDIAAADITTQDIRTNGGDVLLDSQDNGTSSSAISTGVIDTTPEILHGGGGNEGVEPPPTGSGGDITILTPGAVTTDALITYRAGIAGGKVTVNAGGNFTAAGINTGNLSPGSGTPGAIDVRSQNGAVNVTGLGAVITSGSVSLGVNALGNLIVDVKPEATIRDASGQVGIFLQGVGDGISPGCDCEGWGVAANGIAAGASLDNPSPGNLTLKQFTFNPETATVRSVTQVTSLPQLEVTHTYRPAEGAATALFQGEVTFRNLGETPLTNLLYARAMDWDIPPTEFREFVTIQGRTTASNVVYSSDDGFSSVNPLTNQTGVGIVPGTVNTDFVDSGPADQGALFDFSFGDLAPGGSTTGETGGKTFNVFYGATTSETTALSALQAVKAEVFSLGQANFSTKNPNQGPVTGQPGTFIFGFNEVGGTPFVPSPPSSGLTPEQQQQANTDLLDSTPPPLPGPNSPIFDLVTRPVLNPIANLLSLGELDLAIQSFEQQNTDQFTDFLGTGSANDLNSLSVIREFLAEKWEQTGRKPALIYVTLDPTVGLVMVPPATRNLAEGEGKPETLVASTDLKGTLAATPAQLTKPIFRSVPEATREATLATVRKLLNDIKDPRQRNTTAYLESAQTLYKWLVAPLEEELKSQGIDTLVFSLDNGLRLLPLAALHDGQGFLIEKYSLGLIPSINLVDPTFRSLKGGQLPVLAMGASEFRDQSPLPSVPVELKTITTLWPGEFFLNQQFTVDRLRSERQQTPFTIVHLATHADFLPGTVGNSYIEFWNSRLPLDQLRNLPFRNPPVELLVLSACKTAVGNESAELGFAGLAVAAGVKSALASLWYVSDEATLGLMASFYEFLKDGPIKAEALRNAQLALLRGQVTLKEGQVRGVGERGGIPLPTELADQSDRSLNHPYYWSGFALVGSPW
ncbi:MAG: CHAT domain-containing protein [Gloeomargaritaceae cyanobacterium C42_A2020_066]|nr:CHAT domain-containing protein [Gloeomargaritaceae cyanobacterium C42_A2020_066]